MTDEMIERRVREAFEARAGAAIGDVAPPPPRFAAGAGRRRRRRMRLLAPFAAAASVIAVVGSVLAAQQGGGPHHATGPVAGGRTSTSAHAAATAASQAPIAQPAPSGLVRVTGYPGDGATVGVGMPIVATFGTRITDARPFVRATSVTVNGKPAGGAWFFEYSDPASGHAMEAHYRLPTYWPAHAEIHVRFHLQGVSAGKGLAFAGTLRSLDFTTGAAHVAVVDDSTHTMTVSSDGKAWAKFRVSLGSRATPTMRGTKVVMEKGAAICMAGPGYHECDVKYPQQLTYSGEYLHAAPWNVYNIEHGVDSSNGCTNLLVPDAARLYNFLRVGDVVEYPDASGPLMRMGDGYGDWNVPWPVWVKGGVLPTG